MSYWIDATTKANNPRQLQFYVDTDADISKLPTTSTNGVKQGNDSFSCRPCGKGSVAFSIASGNLFVLNSSDNWVQIGG